MSFATLEADLNAAVVAAFSNCTATMNGAPIVGVFDNRSVDQQIGGLELESTGPQFRCLTAAVPAPPNDRTLIVNGTTYTVHRREADNTGMSTLYLHAA